MRRDNSIMVYFSDEEVEMLRKITDATGLSYAAVCRMCVLYVLNEVLSDISFLRIASKLAEKESKEASEHAEI